MEEQQGGHARAYSLGRFVVARTGHVGNVGGDGLDLSHELIADPRIVLRNDAYLASWHQIIVHHNMKMALSRLPTLTMCFYWEVTCPILEKSDS